MPAVLAATHFGEIRREVKSPYLDGDAMRRIFDRFQQIEARYVQRNGRALPDAHHYEVAHRFLVDHVLEKLKHDEDLRPSRARLEQVRNLLGRQYGHPSPLQAHHQSTALESLSDERGRRILNAVAAEYRLLEDAEQQYATGLDQDDPYRRKDMFRTPLTLGELINYPDAFRRIVGLSRTATHPHRDARHR